ncbi:MAG: ABC transporter permease [Saprospiraceae bacterium]|nr:ABC transporter permease [Saprospiraceae bacterium]
MIREILHLLQKEILLEWRRKYALGGIMLYVFSSIYIVYAGFIRIPLNTWNAIFWILVLFISINAVAKSFVMENSRRQLYYYQLARPSAILLSKMIYNSLLLMLLIGLSFLGMSLIAGNPVRDPGLFWITTILASLGLGITFTFTSAIASKANNSAGLLAILSFPLVIPILMSLIKLSAVAVGLVFDSAWAKDVWTLLAIDALLVTLTFILFPYVWKD